MKIDNIIPKKIEFDSIIHENEKLLLDKINSKKALIIGGAGTIGSNYIKQLLKIKSVNRDAMVEFYKMKKETNKTTIMYNHYE